MARGAENSSASRYYITFAIELQFGFVAYHRPVGNPQHRLNTRCQVDFIFVAVFYCSTNLIYTWKLLENLYSYKQL